MTPVEFFHKFSLFAEQPGAIGKMRDLILALALEGKLVSREANDASVKQSLPKLASVGLRVSATDRYPEHWSRIPLGASGAWYGGGTPSKARQDFWIGDVPWVSPKDMKVLLIDDAEDHISEAAIEASSVRVIPRGSLLMVVRGMILAKAFPVAKTTRNVTINQDMKALLLSEPEAAPFVLIALRALQPQVLASVERSSHGTCKLRTDVLEGLIVPLPPLAEQKRIVARVDELMALCDRLEAQQKERDTRHATLVRASLARFADAPAPVNLTFLFNRSYSIAPAELRKSILTLAVQGRLIPQDVTDESAETVVNRLPSLPPPPRFNKRSSARTQGFGAMSVGPSERTVPKGWLCVPLVRIANLESGHTPSRSRSDWWGGDIPWVGLVDARVHDGRTIRETLQQTNEAGLANSAARLLPAGTVCISRTASVGYVIILGRPMATSQDFVNWVPTPAVTSDWLRLVFTAEKGGFARFSKGAVHQTIYYPEWLSMHVMLPPLGEQRRIVAKVDQLMSLVHVMETQLAASRATATKLLDAIVGELTASGRDLTAREPRRRRAM